MRVEAATSQTLRSLLATLPKAAASFAEAVVERPQTPIAHQPPASPTMPMPTVQMLVALSANHPGVERRRRLAQQAASGLEALERLHEALMKGDAAPAELKALAEWVQTVEMPEEPTLAALVRDIDVRVRVELAKLDIRA